MSIAILTNALRPVYVCRRCLLQRSRDVLLQTRRQITVVRKRNTVLSPPDSQVEAVRRRLMALTGESDSGPDSDLCDNGNRRDGQIKIPASIEKRIRSLGTESRRFEEMVDKQMLPIEKLVNIYKSLDGPLERDAATEFAIALYRAGNHDLCCKVLLDNLTGFTFIDAFTKRVVPGLEGTDGREIVLGDLIYLLCKKGYGSLARQLALEMEVSSDLVNDTLTVLEGVNEGFQGEGLIRYVCDMQDYSFDGLNIPGSQCITQASPWLHAVILSELNLTTTHGEIKEVQKMVTQPFVLRAVVLRNFRESKPLTAVKPLMKHGDFSNPDLESLVIAATDRKSFKNAWRLFCRYSQTRERNAELLDKFFSRALQLHLYIEAVNALKKSRGGIQPSRPQLVKLFNWFLRAKYNGSVMSPESTDTGMVMIRRTINSVPKVESSLFEVVKQLNNAKEPCPQFAVWRFVYGVYTSRLVDVTFNLSRELGRLIASSSHLDILRYMSLSEVSAFGVMNALREFITRSATIGNGSATQNAADSKLIIAGLTLIREKQQGDEGGQSKALTNDVVRLFDSWQETRAVALLQNLSTLPLRDDFFTVQSIAWLVHHGRRSVAVELHKRSRINPQLYAQYISANVLRNPVACARLTSWLARNGVDLPVPLLSRLAIIYARSRQMSDAMSMRRVSAILKLIGRQRQKPSRAAAIAVVESVLERASRRGSGSRHRLGYAMGVARKVQVPDEVWQRWLQKIVRMRTVRTGYWGPGYFSLPQK